jgi:hypothetical protein
MQLAPFPKVAAAYAFVAVVFLAMLAMLAPHRGEHSNPDRMESRR